VTETQREEEMRVRRLGSGTRGKRARGADDITEFRLGCFLYIYIYIFIYLFIYLWVKYLNSRRHNFFFFLKRE
jgi:hypothetical protein